VGVSMEEAMAQDLGVCVWGGGVRGGCERRVSVWNKAMARDLHGWADRVAGISRQSNHKSITPTGGLHFRRW
jgi:hypothetical protein